MRLDKERIFAVAATVFVNAALLVLLTEYSAPRSPSSRQSHHEALQVVWINPVIDVPAPALATAPQPVWQQNVSQPIESPKNEEARARPPSDPLPLQSTATVVIGDDLWSPSPSELRQNESLPTGRFERNPLARRDPAFDAQTPLLQLEMRDRSVGGWIQRQTKRSLCSDLKRQLMNTQGSGADAIVATMGRYGCKL